MYTSFFGLNEKPFAITPDPRYLYLSERHAEALAHLLYGINEAGGFIQLTGEVGTGKTTVVRTLLSRVPQHADVAVILNPRVTPAEFLLTICEELGVEIAPGDRGSLKEMVDALNRRLLAAHAEGRRVIVIVDEAQNLAADVLEQVRLLTNLETSTQKLLQIILIGQPELRELLARNDLRQLAQRITGRYHLHPLSREETHGYVRHRLNVAGAMSDIFTPSALHEVHRLSSGIPRVINVTCDRALLGAYTTDIHKVHPALVRRAAGEVYGRRFAPLWVGWLASAASAAVVAGAAYATWRTWKQDAVTPGAAGTTVAPSASAAGSDNSFLNGMPVAGTRAATGTVAGMGTTRGPTMAGTIASMDAAGTAAKGSMAAGTAAAITGATGAATTGAASAVGATAGTVAAQSLDSLLESNAAATTEAAAFRRLLAIWGSTLTADREPCTQAARAGLACFTDKGSWGQLRALNRPAILNLTDDKGTAHRVVLTALSDDSATLALGEHGQRVPLNELSRYWFGDFTLIWKPKTSHARALSVGMRGEEVRWLRRSLNAVHGASASEEPPDLYDQDLAIAVQNFQRDHRLAVDGKAGLQTQVVLDTALADPGSPQLVRPAARGG